MIRHQRQTTVISVRYDCGGGDVYVILQVELSSLLPLEYLNIVAAAVVTESGDPKRVESLKVCSIFHH